MSRSGTLDRTASALLLLFAFLILLKIGGADYVETAPRPGAPLPPAIPPGECPLTFSPADIQEAKQVCSSGTIGATSSGPSSGCCDRLKAVLFQARVKYANSTGRLLLPQASADACIQMLDSSVTAAGGSVVSNCGVTRDLMSETSGKACGEDLTSVYDFWSAANHTFPGVVGSGCKGSTDCSTCTSLITDKIMSLGRGTTALLSTPACQGLAQVAMTAAAYPVIIANSMARCLYQVDIQPVIPAPKCTIWDWNTVNFTSVVLSCGPQQIRADRCCNLILGMYGQVHALYQNQTGHGLIDDQAEACAAEFKAQLAARGVSPAAPDKCLITSTLLLQGVGCYNYTTLLQRAPPHYYEQMETVCNPATSDCTQCKPTFFSIANELANTTSVQYLNLCIVNFGTQYFAGFSTLKDITQRLNCYYQFPPGLELGLADPPLSKKYAHIALIAGVTVTGAVMLVAVLAVALLLWKRRSLLKAGTKSLARMTSLRGRAKGEGLQTFSRKQLRQATGDFDESRMVGKGGSGKVYVGLLKGETVAIKEASFSSVKNGAQEARNELATLARCRHRNLVILKGCCISGSHCSLVYEYMEEGSLEDHLFQAPTGLQKSAHSSVTVRFLDWPTRLKIALGTASGLAYLHEECTPRVIHRDVKASNILLTRDFDAKLADFGLARVTGLDETHVTTGIAGTWGYLSPEYMATGQLTEKSDVYSFGVVLLTLVAGRRPTVPDAPVEEVYLPEWAWALAERNELELLIDPRLATERTEHGESMERMTRLALLCVHTAAAVRPSMRQCAEMLSNSLEVPRLPLRPMTLYTIASMASTDSGTASMIRTPQQLNSEAETSERSDSAEGSFKLTSITKGSKGSL